MPFAYVDREFCRIDLKSMKKSIPLSQLAERIQAPFYFYDGDEILERASWFKKYSRAKVHFAMKSNSEIHVLRALASAGFGVDVVSPVRSRRRCARIFAQSRLFTLVSQNPTSI